MDKYTLENLIREIVTEMVGTNSRSHGVRKVSLPSVTVRDKDRLDTGNPQDKVFTRDLFTISESPRLGCGLMEMTNTTFHWELSYDEIDYVIDGELSVIIDGEKITAGPGEIILIPKNSSIEFSVNGKARFLYVVYPANWQEN